MSLLPLSKRNAETAEVALRALSAQVHAAAGVIKTQQDMIGQLMSRVQTLEQFMTAYSANLVGRGPTVK